MKFKVLLRKSGGARARAADREFLLEIRPFGGSCFLGLSIMLHDTTRGGGSWWSCQLIDPSGWGVGGMAGHAGPPVGPASDVVLPLHSLKKERCDLIGEALEARVLARPVLFLRAVVQRVDRDITHYQTTHAC